MKRLLTLMMAALLLAACGNDEPEEQVTDEPVLEEKATNEESEPIELAEGTMYPIAYFGTEESYADLTSGGEGNVATDFEGFHVDSQFLLADFVPSEEYAYLHDDKENIRAIMVLMQAENTTEHDVDYNGDVMIVTDTKEQVYGESGILSENSTAQSYFGKVEEVGYYIIPLKDDSTPKTIEVTMGAPYEMVDGSVDPIDGKMGEDVTLELTAYE